MVSGVEVLDAIAGLPTYGAETWNRLVNMPVITRIRIEETPAKEVEKIARGILEKYANPELQKLEKSYLRQ